MLKITIELCHGYELKEAQSPYLLLRYTSVSFEDLDQIMKDSVLKMKCSPIIEIVTLSSESQELIVTGFVKQEICFTQLSVIVETLLFEDLHVSINITPHF